MKCIRMFLRTKEGHILLSKREIHLCQFIKRGELARIGLIKPDMGHGLRDGVGLALLLVPSSSLALFHGWLLSLLLLLSLFRLFLFSHPVPVLLHLSSQWNEQIAGMDHGADLDTKGTHLQAT